MALTSSRLIDVTGPLREYLFKGNIYEVDVMDQPITLGDKEVYLDFYVRVLPWKAMLDVALKQRGYAVFQGSGKNAVYKMEKGRFVHCPADEAAEVLEALASPAQSLDIDVSSYPVGKKLLDDLYRDPFHAQLNAVLEE